jgi:hypothetical protein
MGVSKKSIYNPSNPKKYKGNANNIICRSNWERRFCKWCDLTENILEWGSEEFLSHTCHQLIKEFTDTSPILS